jgi:site-specific DNA recombinase
VPCSYVRDQRMVARGKRKCHTSGLWRPSRVRNLLVSTTYMGKRLYGKRSRNPNRQPIEQTVPAIVSEDVWRKVLVVPGDGAILAAAERARAPMVDGADDIRSRDLLEANA